MRIVVVLVLTLRVLQPILTKGDLSDLDKYCKLMMEGKLAGRAVLKVAA